MNFNEKLQSLRKSKGITQEELADRLDVTRQTISKWECGESTPDFRNLVKLSEIFEVSTDHLLKDTDDFQEGQCDGQTQNNNTGISETRNIKIGLDKKSLLGACLFIVGTIGIIVFFILSVTYPMSVLNEYGYFDGLLGFLIWQKALWAFCALCVMSLVGLILLILPFFKTKKEKRKDQTDLSAESDKKTESK